MAIIVVGTMAEKLVALAAGKMVCCLAFRSAACSERAKVSMMAANLDNV